MIIQSLQANNILKYDTLQLDDLPESGIIAISGLNESGKTAIGETICLALFGRTFSFADEALSKVLKWSTTHSMVSLQFKIAETSYQIIRHFDADGNHSVKLTQTGDLLIAKGCVAVQKKMRQLLGFDYNEFIDSFYLAQREITLPHPKGDTVKTLVGIKKLEDIADSLIEEVEQLKQDKITAKTEITSTNLEIMELNLDESYLNTLNKQLDETTKAFKIKQEERETSLLNQQALQQQQGQLNDTITTLLAMDVGASVKQWRREEKVLQSHLQHLKATCEKIKPDCQSVISMQEFGHAFTARLGLFEQVNHTAQAYHQTLSEKLDKANPESLLQDKIDCFAKIKKINRKKLLNQMILFICLVITIGCGLSIYAIKNFSQHEVTERLMANGDQAISKMPQEISEIIGSIDLMIGLGGVFLVFWLYFLFRSFRINRFRNEHLEWVDDINVQIETAEFEAKITKDPESMPISTVIEQYDNCENEVLPKVAQYFNTHGGAIFVNPKALQDHNQLLQREQQQSDKNIVSLLLKSKKISDDLEKDIDVLQQQSQQYSQDISEEQARRIKNEQLQKIMMETNQKLKTYQEQKAVCQLAKQLIEETNRKTYAQFAMDLKAYVSHITPQLTQERYEYLKIDEALNVKLFSKEKNDFLSLEEMSSGTQRQVTLALRIALSEALLQATCHEKQFIILDEPFAFFDQERINSAVTALPGISHLLCQIWITSQEFADDSKFAYHIACVPDQQSLKYPIK